MKSLPWKEYLQEVRDNPTHLFWISWSPDYLDANSWYYDNFHPKYSENWIRWNSKEFQELIEKARSTQDFEEKNELYRKAEILLSQKEAAIVPLYFGDVGVLTKPWLKWTYSPIGGQRIYLWRVAPQNQNLESTI